MIYFRAAVLLTLIAIASPAAAQRGPDISARSSTNSSVNRWVQQLASDLDHLQEDLVYERGSYPAGLREQVDEVSQSVAHFQHVLEQSNDQRHLARDFKAMDEEVHRLVRTLNQSEDRWLRRQGARLNYSDDQLHYALRDNLQNESESSREVLIRQVHLLDREAAELQQLAERVNRRDRRLREAIRDFADKVEHFHQVVEDGGDGDHVHEDFRDVDEAWHHVVERLNRSTPVLYLRTAAQNVNRVHNQIHELLAADHGHTGEGLDSASRPTRDRRAIQFDIPGVGRVQIPQ